MINQEHLLEKTNLAALAIAKEVVAEHPGTILAGNVCNTTAYSPGDEKTHEEARLMFREQIGWAKESGCSLIVGETFDHYGEAKIALEEINAAGLPAVITFALANWLSGEKKGDAFLLQDDVPIVEACLKLHRMGAAVVGLFEVASHGRGGGRVRCRTRLCPKKGAISNSLELHRMGAAVVGS